MKPKADYFKVTLVNGMQYQVQLPSGGATDVQAIVERIANEGAWERGGGTWIPGRSILTVHVQPEVRRAQTSEFRV